MSSSQSVYRASAFADFEPELSAPGATPERLAHLEEHGFVIIDDFVDNPWIPVLREAGRRVTEACAPENGYDKIDCSKGYVHRTGNDEPWGDSGAYPSGFWGAVFCRVPRFARFSEFCSFVV